jgi:hypothetical protein
MVSDLNMPMDREIGHASTSYLANYPEPSYVAPYVIKFSAPYATGDIHNSAPHLHNGYSRISGNSIEAQVPSSSVAAYEDNDWKEKPAAEFKKLNALHLELQERPHDIAAIQAYEAYKKRREEERQAFNIKFCPAQLPDFGDTSLPKETEHIGGQTYPSWAEAKAKFMAHTKKVKPMLTGNNVGDFTTPTFEELPAEYRQAYEVLRMRRNEEFEDHKRKLDKKYEEEDLHEFLASLKKDHQDNITQVEKIKSLPPCSEQVEPSAKSKKEEEALQSNKIHEENKNDSASVVNSVIEAE